MIEQKEEREWQQLANVVTARNNIDQIVWIVFGIFWTVNTLLLIALFSGGRLPTDSVVGQVLCIAGLAFCLVWYLIQRRALAYLAYFDAIVQEIETSVLRGNVKMAMSTKLNVATSEGTVRKSKPGIRPLMAWCYRVVFFVWLFGASLFLMSDSGPKTTYPARPVDVHCPHLEHVYPLTVGSIVHASVVIFARNVENRLPNHMSASFTSPASNLRNSART